MKELREIKHELHSEYGFMGLLGVSPAMQKLYKQIQNASTSEASVIICGESGTGKELVADAIHKLSRRKEGPFVKINCASLNEFLLESELFGHVKGAFTGAIKSREGRFEAANDGSIFLDEIGDMPSTMQIKLLRVLEEKEIERVGNHRPISINVRIITATNKDICSIVDKGKFREDLFYRINAIPIYTPALGEKKEDLPILISHFLEKISHINQKNVLGVSSEAMRVLEAYHWPGNVRQLINTLQYAAVTCEGKTIDTSDFPEYILQNTQEVDFQGRDYKKRGHLISVLSKYNYSRTLTARHFGISRVTLWKQMKKFNIKL